MTDFVQAVQVWDKVEFQSLKKALKGQAVQIAEMQSLGVANRKELSTKTKEFKRLSEEQKLAAMKPLLKLYQTEIDNLTSRCKFAEERFLECEKQMSAAPDPKMPLKEAANEIARLKNELAARADYDKVKTRAAAHDEEELELQKRLETLTNEVTKQQSASAAKISRLQSLLDAQAEEFANAKERLKSVSDYDALKGELEVLRQINLGGAPAGSELAQALQTRNDQLVTESTRLRVQNESLQKRNNELEVANHELSGNLERSRALIEQLEHDLVKVKRDDTFSTVSGWATQRPSAAASISAFCSRDTSQAQHDGPSTEVLQLVTQQRDRYKEHNARLEQDLHQATALLGSLRKEADAAKSENAALMDRLRTMQGGSRLTRSSYEEGLSAFQQFKNLETERLLAGMGSVDHVLFAYLRAAMLDKRVRYCSAVYVLLIHIGFCYSVLRA